VFGYNIVAQLRICAKFGETKRVEKLLHETTAVIEADKVTGEDCFLARVVAIETYALQAVIECFQPFSAVDTTIFLSPTVPKRLPNLLDSS
jgi:Lrp/AsnC family leucine-responsive transcriptional regulator